MQYTSCALLYSMYLMYYTLVETPYHTCTWEYRYCILAAHRVHILLVLMYIYIDTLGHVKWCIPYTALYTIHCTLYCLRHCTILYCILYFVTLRLNVLHFCLKNIFGHFALFLTSYLLFHVIVPWSIFFSKWLSFNSLFLNTFYFTLY